MMNNFEINSKEIDKIEKITNEEKSFRIKNLEIFKIIGFPNKRLEDWKFSDFENIVNENFDNLDTQENTKKFKEINLLKDFDHNYIFLVNGNLQSSNFDYEDKSKIKINSYDKSIKHQISNNPLVCLNHALADNGYSLEIKENYKFKKVLVIYNFFTQDIKNKILNNKNKIKLNNNSELHIIEYTINKSKHKFINNSYESVIMGENSKFRNLNIQSCKSEGFFHKFLKNTISFNSDYLNLIFSSGLKFNKLDIHCDLVGQKAKCNILSGLFLNKNEHQEIKTCINHIYPNSKSFQKIKNVLSSESKGIFQGKIFVKNKAQKTDAYQLSKALLLDDSAEFNSKPELEIYADDVKCSHGSASGSLNENSIFYLMSRGLNYREAKELLINGFLLDVVEKITDSEVRNLIKNMIGLKE